ncbi:MAG: HAMP domain-containing protein [Chloroflexi bacterium]|nr:HAMP domain-containing protein [Chloroflexota bacterium]
MGRYLNDAEIERLAEIAYMPLELYRLDADMPSDVQSIRPSLSEETPIAMKPLSGDAIAGYSLLTDIYGEPILILKAEMPRDIYQKGQESMRYFLIGLLCVGVVLGGVTVLILERSVLSQLARLSASVKRIGSSGDLSTRLSMPGKDELSVLAGSMNGMLEALQHSQQELQKYSGELERMVEDRTRELREAQEKLVRAEKLAAIGEVAGGIAHELRTPLAAIKLSADFLEAKLEGTADEKAIKHLVFLKKEVDACNKTINDLLDFARPAKPGTEQLDINEIVRSVIQASTLPQNVKAATDLATGLPPVTADASHIRRALSNLILNAVQAMPDGGQLTLSTAQKGKFIEVKVTDTGVGVPEENLGKVFEPLFTTKAKGIGLGLVIAKASIERQGGTIEVESQVGKGTTFTVRLPVGEEALHE